MGKDTAGPLRSDELVDVVARLREGVQVIDRDYRYVYLNDAAVAHARTPREQLLGRSMAECYPGIETTAMFARLRGCMERRIPDALENEFRYPDGATGWFELRMSPCDAGVVVLSIDVTQRRIAESQLRHAQQMDAVGRLAGSVAHDFNNALSVILSFSALILDDMPADDPLQPDIAAIKRAGERAAELTHRLVGFSRRQASAPRVIDVNELLREVEPMLERLLGDGIALELALAPDVPPVSIDPHQLEQVVANLVSNARDASQAGGRVTVSTRPVVLDATHATAHFGVTPGVNAQLAVRDDGSGMDAEVQARLFEPFFTTKKQGKGAGLGLATVFGIVHGANGTVMFRSAPGAGTTCEVCLPAAAAKPTV